MTYQYLSYYAQRNFIYLNKMFVKLFSAKCKQNIKHYQFFVTNRIAVVPCVPLIFSTISHCAPDKYGDKKRMEILEPKTLTHEYLIKQACTLNVDAATQLLTLTVAALLDINKDYRETLEELISFTEESLQTISMSAYQEEIWDQIIETRAHMEDLKKSLLELSGFMEYVEKVATSAAEASYLGGADYASTAMCERINSAHQQLQLEEQKTKTLEEALLITQESYVKKATSFGRKDDVGKAGRKTQSPLASQITGGLIDEESDP